MELWLIRHGETETNNVENYDYEKMTSNPPLTNKGERQAKALADRCMNVKFDRIISSDLKRAVRTAEYLAGGRQIVLEQEVNFREIEMGDLYYKASWSDYPKLFEQWKKHEEDIAYPNGENGLDVWNRCKKSLDTILNENSERVAIVCHGGTIRSIVCGLLGLPQVKRFSLGSPLCNCSITIFTINEGQVALHTLNEHSHIVNIQ